MSDTERHDQGIAVASFLSGLLHAAITNAKRDDLLDIQVDGVWRVEDGWWLECRTGSGFGIDVSVSLAEWSGERASAQD